MNASRRLRVEVQGAIGRPAGQPHLGPRGGEKQRGRPLPPPPPLWRWMSTNDRGRGMLWSEPYPQRRDQQDCPCSGVQESSRGWRR